MELQKLMNDIQKWSDNEFDNGEFNKERCLPIAHHLDKEVKELVDALSLYFSKKRPNDDSSNDQFDMDVKEEITDCMMLILDIASHFGMDAKKLINSTQSKLEINKNRKWNKPDENGVSEHLR